MALFLITNNLTAEDVLDTKRELAFPESVVDLLAGRMGEPPGGFPPLVRERILRGQKPVSGRPAKACRRPISHAKASRTGKAASVATLERATCLSYLMFPRVFTDYVAHEQKFGDTSVLPTPTVFLRPANGEEISFDIEQGKRLIIKFLTIGDPQPDGRRTVFFELNGQPRKSPC